MEKADASCVQNSKAAAAVTTKTRRMDVAPNQAAILAHARRQNCCVRATLLKICDPVTVQVRMGASRPSLISIWPIASFRSRATLA